ncbi:hypothetical protein BKA69DRAFT_22947 [Paraphysoderma sedebokerense]|nr:hypothetical protein BKA69DRAFT_22947 [Paraphysoderma sedebokerense]
MVVPEPVQEQYRLLRQRLDQLEYRDPFRPDSMRLIQKLLSDLIQTTESCKRLKLSKDNLIQEKKSLEQTLEPLRTEISRLTAENNQLHVTIINETDKRESQAKKTAIVIRKLENEISDLKFLNSQYLNRIHAEQKRADDERKRVEDLFKKWGIWATVNDGEGTLRFQQSADMACD